MSESTLEVTELTKSFNSGDQKVEILKGISFQMHGGQNAAIVGPSGCGKSTLLYILGALETPSSGTVQLGQQDPFQLSGPALAKFRNQSIGFIFQDHHLLPQLTVQENVLLPALASGEVTSEIKQRSLSLIEQIGLAHRIDSLPAKLSGGERQRVAVARAMLLKPLLLLADEPTGSLDEGNSGKVAELMLQMQQQEGSMLLCVTHSPALAARFQSTMRLHDGKIVE